MTKDAVATMGTILTDDVGGRDAVHVAVLAVRASQKLEPGQPVGLRSSTEGEHLALKKINPIGIVDPFLDRNVQIGERFWLYLFPRTITSLRHNWTHPDFPNENIESDALYRAPVQKFASERWLRDFVSEKDVGSYESLIEAVGHFKGGTEWLTIYGSEARGDIPPEFWDHVEVVLSRKISVEKRAKHFTCSC